jgi:hypothetical protein
MWGRGTDATRTLLRLGFAICVCAVLSGCQVARPTAPAKPITVVDVRSVLTSMDTAADISSDYRVDVLAFAASVVGQMPLYVDTTDPALGPTTFRAPDNAGGGSQRRMTRAEASATVAEAASVFRRIASAEGSQAADTAMISAGRGVAQGSRSAHDQNLLSLLQEGAGALTFMFGPPDPQRWTWKVTGIALAGPDTAAVTYAVAVPKGGEIGFTRATHVKRLHFKRRADGVWVLDGWLDYPAFEHEVKSSIEPQNDIPNLVPNWWDTLGAR